MATRKGAASEKLRYRIRQFQDDFSNYENAVTFISSLEAWFEHRWGEKGTDCPRLLQRFDRFPSLDGLTPDFVVYFRRPYLLIGEHIKTFRRGEHGKKDVAQLVAYSRWAPGGGDPGRDVVVFVDIFSDDAAAEQIEPAWNGDEASRPIAPIVILGYSLDRERTQGEWYKIKWRKHPGNRRFSNPNISEHHKLGDLNAILTTAAHHAIPVDRPALDLTKRGPLINDAPPPFYTVVRVLLPALSEMLTEDERDQLQQNQRILKTVSRDDLLEAPLLKSINPRPRVIQEALDFLVEPLGLAAKVKGNPPKYAVTINLRQLSGRDWKDFVSDRAARSLVKKLKSLASGRRKRGDAPGQLRMFQ